MGFKSKVNVLSAIVCFVLFFTITLQYKSVTKNSTAGISEAKRVQEIEVQLINAKGEIINLKKENMALSSDIDVYRQEAANEDSGSAALKAELEKMQLTAGLTDVEGPGIEISLADSVKVSSGNDDTSIIHDSDLRDVVNELFGAGAEAVSINSERIVSNTAIRCVGSTVMINDKRISSPFVIKAIGDISSLDGAVNIRGGVLDVLKLYGIQANVTKSSNIKIGKFSGHISFTYAKSKK